MFNASTYLSVRDAIQTSFCDLNGNLRVVFAMCLDCPNVRRVIHWGPFNDAELYCKSVLCDPIGENI